MSWKGSPFPLRPELKTKGAFQTPPKCCRVVALVNRRRRRISLISSQEGLPKRTLPPTARCVVLHRTARPSGLLGMVSLPPQAPKAPLQPLGEPVAGSVAPLQVRRPGVAVYGVRAPRASRLASRRAPRPVRRRPGLPRGGAADAAMTHEDARTFAGTAAGAGGAPAVHTAAHARVLLQLNGAAAE